MTTARIWNENILHKLDDDQFKLARIQWTSAIGFIQK